MKQEKEIRAGHRGHGEPGGLCSIGYTHKSGLENGDGRRLASREPRDPERTGFGREELN